MMEIWTAAGTVTGIAGWIGTVLVGGKLAGLYPFPFEEAAGVFAVEAPSGAETGLKP